MPLLAVLIAGGALWRSFTVDRTKETKAKFEAIDLRLDKKADKDQVGVLVGKVDLVEHRVTVVENDLKHLPDQKTVNKLEGMIGTLSKDVGMLSERIKPIAAMADRIQEAIVEKVMA